MSKTVLLTGAFGNVGQYCVEYLLANGHKVVALDRKSPAGEKVAQQFGERVQTCWGDITNEADLKKAIIGVDTVIHLAAVIPPVTETNIPLATKVNVDATKSLIKIIEESEHCNRFIFASSVAVHGKDQTVREPPLTPDSPYMPDDHYGETKLACELAIKESTLDWTILRICVAPPISIDFIRGNHDHKMIFDISPDCRIEYVHPQDCALGFANAVDTDECIRRILLLGGGESCQVSGLDFNNGMMSAYGLLPMPREAYAPGIPSFYGDYMDTVESQRILRYQQHSFQDALDQSAKAFGPLRHVIKALGSPVRFFMVRSSPYYKK